MNITCSNNTIDMEAGMTVMQCLLALRVPTQGVLAVRMGGAVLELYDEVRSDGVLVPLTLRDEEGRRIYERSLRFVLLLAIRHLMPGQRVRIEYSVGGGVFLCTPGRELTPADCSAIEQEMRRLTGANLPFDKREWSLDDAIAYFEAEGQRDKVELLKRRPFPFFNMYECDGMWEYFYGAMTPSTWYVRVFGVKHLPGRGMALLLPDSTQPERPATYIDRPKHLHVFDQSAAWCGILGVQNAPDLDRLIEERGLRAFIRVNEALHARAIAEIADLIAERGRRLVMIAGPSSSGKTTFTGRLAIALRVLGFQPVQISLDDYYRNRADLPVEPDGSVDLEALHTIDVPLFREHMVKLMAGEKVEIPRFCFRTGSREPRGVPLTLRPGQPVLIEGIHGLNPQLCEGVPEEYIHRIFVSALTCINLDDHNRIRTTDVRLLRRIVRDNQFRGTSPEETLAMWPSVRKGEETWIFPYQECADSMFNTALHYELPILRRYAYGLLRAIPTDNPHYLTARRLVKMLNYFPEVSEDVMDEIPPLSLLREFVGGCTIDKE
ncbi:MAG: nucleoside kinase [Clostridia bacterium]|nr:nucleoside kinase [Clostridia bacterium]